MIICGPGGVGKTSLAFQIARWAMVTNTDTDATSREESRTADKFSPMIPVLIEGEVEYDAAQGRTGFLEFIGSKLRSITREADPIDAELVMALLTRRQILLIIDGFSEMSEESRRRVLLYENELPINSVIVTARNEEFRNKPRRLIKAPPLRKAAVAEFVESYLKYDGREKLFDEAEFHKLCEKLATVVGGRNITPLIAKMYAEHCVRSKTNKVGPDVADIPGLFSDYLTDTIERFSPGSNVDLEGVSAFARSLAWACVKREFRASAIKRSEVKTLNSDGDPKGTDKINVYLDFLSKRAGVLTTHGGEGGVSFQFDPAAEYFAARHLIDEDGKGKGELLKVLEEVGGKLKQRLRVGDFAVALIDSLQVLLPGDAGLREICERLEEDAANLRSE
jgi:hypothetical protein